MYFGLVIPAYGFGMYIQSPSLRLCIQVALYTVYFAPAIVQSLGHSAIRAQLLSVPPYACAFVVGMTVAWASDYFKHRFLFALVSAILSLAGFIVMLTGPTNTNLEYAMLFLGAVGAYTGMPLVLCWYSMNGELYLYAPL